LNVEYLMEKSRFVYTDTMYPMNKDHYTCIPMPICIRLVIEQKMEILKEEVDRVLSNNKLDSFVFEDV